MQNILVPTDLTDESLSAVEIAKVLAKQFNATIYLLHVVDTSNLFDQGREGEEAIAAKTERAAEDLRKFVYWKLIDRGKVIPALTHGRPPEQIVQYAAAAEVDLIVMATHCRKADTSHFVGSIAEEVNRLTDIPVLTVKVRAAGALSELIAGGVQPETTPIE